MTAILALILTFVVAYGIVEAALVLAGPSRVARGVVLAIALLAGFAIPWGIIGGLVGLLTADDEA